MVAGTVIFGRDKALRETVHWSRVDHIEIISNCDHKPRPSLCTLRRRYCGLWKSWDTARTQPPLQPLNEPSTPTAGHMVQWAPPACLARSLSLPACLPFNHSSFWLSLQGPPHSMQISVMQQGSHTQSQREPKRERDLTHLN